MNQTTESYSKTTDDRVAWELDTFHLKYIDSPIHGMQIMVNKFENKEETA